jgi:cytochrome c553
MSDSRLFSFSNRWSWSSVGIILSIALLAAGLGLMIFPFLQPEIKPKSLWDAICGAAGVPSAAPASAIITSTAPVSRVMLTSSMFGHPDSASIERGAVLARTCAVCHGGVDNTTAKFPSPNLVGQTAGAIYKQLEDYRSGVRHTAVMEQFVLPLREQDIVDLSVYYAHMPHVPGPKMPSVDEPSIVAVGAPTRNIPACGVCHGGAALKVGTPWLDGQSVVYLRGELNAYADGSRTNDINAQMRAIARQMSPDEIEQASRYFASLQ